LIENNRVEAVMSLPGGVFQPYSGVKTSVLLFKKGGKTDRVLFLHVENDGYKLDANHDTPIEADDLPELVTTYRERDAKATEWAKRDAKAPWHAKWWIADAAELRTNEFNLSAGRYRPVNASTAVHRDPRELLDDLAELEREITAEVEALRESLSENT
jgi:type I restriction enzyme M protein